MSAVSRVCQDSRSLVSAAEHVGEHTDGITGWRLVSGSGGICAWRAVSAIALDEGGELVAQAVLSSASTITVSSNAGLGILGLLGVGFDGRGQGLLFGGDGALMLQRLLAGVGFGAGVVGDQLVDTGFGLRQLDLDAGRDLALADERGAQHAKSNRPGQR